MKALVIGLGIGSLYQRVLGNLNYNVDTVDIDTNKNPTFTDVSQIQDNYDISVVCTPNHTHDFFAKRIAKQSKIVLVEKPGLKNSASWKGLVNYYPNTRFMMIKNNQYRENIDTFKQHCDNADYIKIYWINKNRIPSPGGWFTNKHMAFGGVSRDLIPHMLSYFCILENYDQVKQVFRYTDQVHQLKDITSTDYGTVDKNGIYNVDDVCKLVYLVNNKTWTLYANWKSDTKDKICIEFNDSYFIPLDLCPEQAYQTMITTAMENLNNDEFWADQLKQDLWIHEQIEIL